MNFEPIYLDYAASTPLDPAVLYTLSESYKTLYGNTSGIHSFAQSMENELENSRTNLAGLLQCRNSELIFTSSATESNNTVIKGIAQACKTRGKHIIISQVEHASVEKTCKYLENNGFRITYLPVDSKGLINPEDVDRAITDDTILVSAIWVNNETGTIQPIEEIGTICRRKKVLFHSDAVQGFGKIDMDLHNLPVDLLTASSHKIYGPIGAGLIYKRAGIELVPLLLGGGQEFDLRASTVNVQTIRGFVHAAQLMAENRKQENNRIFDMAAQLKEGVRQGISNFRINSSDEHSIASIVNISFAGADSEMLVMMLNKAGLAVSSGSSCASGNIQASRILKACKLPQKWLTGAIRLSLGRFTTEKEIEQTISILKQVVEKVRKLS